MNHGSQVEEQNNRRFHRLKAAIPCVITWQGDPLTGQVNNLSHGGAFISHVDHVPPAGTPITIELRAGEEQIPFPALVRVGEPNPPPASFGIEFLGNEHEIESGMIRLLEALFPDPEQYPSRG